MEDPSRGVLGPLAFAASAALLAFVYGYFARVEGWFPAPQVRQAILQADRLHSPPHFVADRVHDRTGVRFPAGGPSGEALTVLVSRWPESGWEPEIRILDRRGRIHHSWVVDGEEIFRASADRRPEWSGIEERSLHGVHLFDDGDVIANLAYVGTVRLDACGSVRWRLPAGGHHSVEPAGDGSFWIPGNRRRDPPHGVGYPDGYPGLGGERYQDVLMRVSPEGEVLEEIVVLDLLFRNGLERHIVRSGQLTARDVSHVNDIEPLPDSMADAYPGFDAGDLLVSLRNLDLVLVLDPGTRRVKWHASHPFIQQHDPDFLGDGWIGVFDNRRDGTDRGGMLGGTRVVAVRPETDSVRVLFPTPVSDTLYTPILGKWQQLDGGGLLLVEGRAGRVIETDPEGRTVWEWVGPPYDESGIAEVTQATRIALTPEAVAAWPCSPPSPDSSGPPRAPRRAASSALRMRGTVW